VTSSLHDNSAFELASGFLQAPTNMGAIGYALLGEVFWAKRKNNACDLHGEAFWAKWKNNACHLHGEAFWAKWKNNACDLQCAFEQETKSFKLQ
jgi:hypothetical protein